MRISALVNTLRVASISLFIVLLSSCGGSSDNKYSGFVVIGASLSDTGNVSAATSGATPGAAPNYFGGRWSNGVLWIENLATKYGLTVTPSLLGGKNYAYGGAKTCTITGVTSSVPDMCTQTTQYLAAVSNVANPGDLFVIDASTVGNDINAVIGSGGLLPSSLITTTAPANVISVMQRLYTAGARRFLVVNVPNVGATPLYTSGYFGSTGAATGTTLAQGFNTTLTSSLNTFASTNPGSVLFRLDAYAISSTINANPTAYGLNNVTQACTTGAAPAAICATPDTYAYWDTFHPTKVVGVIIGNAAAALVK
jgi:outer membrane lipase/esterase